MAIFRATMTGDIYNSRGQNVVHFQKSDAVSPTDELALIADLIAPGGWLQEIRFCQNANWSWRQIAAQIIDTPDHPVVVVDITPIAGTLTGVGYHPSVAGVFSLRTAFPGKRGRGRFYMPGVHQDSVQNGVVHPGAVTVFQGAANAIAARYAVNGSSQFRLVVVGRNTLNDPKSVTNILARSRWGLQRRRNIGVGI